MVHRTPMDLGRERKARKSEPVKNAVFIGAMDKDKCRIRPLPARGTAIKEETLCMTEISTGQNEFATPKGVPSDGHRSRQSGFSSKSSLRMSTPVRNHVTSPRRSNRRTSCADSESDRDRSRSILSSTGSRRRYHPKYDPYIEIRRAKERLEQYKTQCDWTVDMLLCEDADEDLRRYELKLKRRQSMSDTKEPIELERRQVELLRRQRDIDQGKVTDKYAEFVLSVPKPDRLPHHPRTPNKFRLVSRRAWDGMIKKWRKHMHCFDDEEFMDTWRSMSDLSGFSSLTNSRAASVHDSDISSVNSSYDEAVVGQLPIALDSGVANPLTKANPATSLGASTKLPELSTSGSTGRQSGETKTSPTLAPQATFGSTQVPHRGLPPGVEDEDEDTLQGAVPMPPPTLDATASVKPNVRTRSSSRGPSAEEEPESSAWRLIRKRSSQVAKAASNGNVQGRGSFGQYKRNGPTPDMLHSGLTNDMLHMGTSAGVKLKRAADIGDENACNDVPVTSSMNDFPALKSAKTGDVTPSYLSSPSKKQRRMGILAASNAAGMQSSPRATMPVSFASRLNAAIDTSAAPSYTTRSVKKI